MRLSKLDFLRGHYLIAVLVDHIGIVLGSSIFIFYNGNGFLWVSAAEGFVFLSGFFIGYLYVYSTKYSIGEVTRKLLSKALQLYVITASLTIIYTLVIKQLGLNLDMGGTPHPGTTLEMIKNTLMLKYDYGWANIISLYVPYIFISPLVIYFFRKKAYWAVLIPSFLLWIYSTINPIVIPYVSHFSFLSWQFLFFLGVFAGSSFDSLVKAKKWVMERRWAVVTILSLFVITVFLSVLHAFYGQEILVGDRVLEILFVKYTIGYLRIPLFLLWMTAMYIIISFVYGRLPKFVKTVYETFGRNSLNTYILQSIFMFVIQVVLKPEMGYWLLSLVILATIIINYYIISLIERFKRRLKRV